MEKFTPGYKYLFFSIFIFSFIIFLIHSAYTKNAVFADARFYYSYTHSLIQDHNLDLKNEYLDLNIQKIFAENRIVTNPYPPGVSIFWIPLYTNVKALYTTLGITNSGYEFLYQLSAALTNIFLGILGLYLIFRLLQKYFSTYISFLTTLALFGTTNLLFYIAVEPINSHAVSFFVSSLFIFYLLYKSTQKEKDYYLALGFIGGIAGLVRTQDLMLLVLPAIKIIMTERKQIKSFLIHHLYLFTGFLAGFLPQLLLWKYFYNTLWYSPYFNTGFSLLKPHIASVLFNSQNGLFTITPIIAVSLAGSFLLIRRKYNSLLIYILTYFILQLYLISAWNSDQGGSYSIRMIITTYPLLSLGLAYLIEKTVTKFKERLTFAILIVLSLVNCGFIIRYLLKY